jgi:tetratricopeptide (TPR) repeat protein
MISVLLVEDDPAILELTRIFLERSGDLQVVTSRDVAEANGILKDRSFDVIVSDYEMPHTDGLVFLKSLRGKGDRVPFIMFTGKGREWVAMEALNNGADFYLTKEDDPQARFSELRDMIHLAVKRRELERSRPGISQESVDLINILPDATFAIDAYGRVIAWNQAMEMLTGVKAADIMHKGNHEYAYAMFGTRDPILIDLVLRNDDSLLKDRYSRVRMEGDSYSAELRGVRLKGKEVDLWVRVRRISDKQGNILAAIESVHDITQVRQAAVLQKEEKSTGLMDRLFGKDGNKERMTGFQRGQAFQQQGRYEESLSCFDHAIEKEKADANAWMGKGISLKELGRYEEALQCFDQALFISPGDPGGHYNRGETLEKLGKSSGQYRLLEEALPEFERVIALQPENWRAWNYSALCYKELGKPEEAKRRFDRAEILLHQSRGFDPVPKITNVAAARKKPGK